MRKILLFLFALSLAFARPAWALPTATLTWTDTNAAAVSYVIQRKLGSTGTYSVDLFTTAHGATSYADTTITAGQSYCYHVAAISGTDRSAYTPDVCGILLTTPGNLTIQLTP